MASVGKWEVPQSLMRRWLPRKTQIAMVEAFAAVLVVDQYRHDLAGKRALLFIDADAVLAALIKGYSAKEDLCELVGYFWRRCAASRIAVYLDRVPTDANPADAPSRGSCEELCACGAVADAATPSRDLWDAAPDPQ